MNDAEIIALPFETRAEAVLACAFHGIHHCPTIKKKGDADFQRWETNHSGDLATFDFDGLTRLVIAAHFYCVRVSVRSSGPGMIKILIHNRKGRTGSLFSVRHATMTEALETINPLKWLELKGKPCQK